MSLTVRAELHLLEPSLRVSVEAVLEDLRGGGFNPRVFETWRSPERQAVLFRRGASKARVSQHSATDASGRPASRAVDIIDRDAGWKSESFFDLLAGSAERHGLESGHRWKWRDSAHIQLR